MAVIDHDSAPFKPYARLMNILGDQLITDKKVAIMEIVKNSYDADATQVNIKFCNLSNTKLNDLPTEEQAYIEIEDNGYGMSLETIKNVWLRPATPDKFNKKIQKKTTTTKGRIIQGEKGIGRFAVHKLGEKIEVYTKAANENEVKLEMNFVDFDPDNINLFNQQQEYKLLEEVSNNWYVNNPPEKVQSKSGTIIRIYNLRERWSDKDFEELNKNIQQLIPPIDPNAKRLGIDFKKDFHISLYVEGENYENIIKKAKEAQSNENRISDFNDVIERAQFTMIGGVDQNGILSFDYKSSSPFREFNKKIDLFDFNKNEYDLYGIKFFKNNHIEKPKCGPFSFTFYAFDLNNPDKTILDKSLIKFIKENFVFVLRDGIRVYPYGEKGIDWLNLDKLRSTHKAGKFMSYNDLTGFIYISQEKNPSLKDASNRQGIVNDNGLFDEFTNLVTAITEIFNTEIKIDKLKKEIEKKTIFKNSKKVLNEAFEKLQRHLNEIGDKKTLDLSNSFLKIGIKHLDVIEDRLGVVEDLAGVGMAVERSSHDSLRLMSLMSQNIKRFERKIKEDSYNKIELLEFLSELSDGLDTIYEDIQIIQPLFKFQRKANKDVSMLEVIGKVLRYFRNDIDNKIETNIGSIKDDIVINTNLGLMLQVIINLVDNAVYWLNKTENRQKKLYFYLNSSQGILQIADNGGGIREDVTHLIFQEFFSMKSEGRGLGLYIVKELLDRINAEIFVVENQFDKILPGANFVIKFDSKDNK